MRLREFMQLSAYTCGPDTSLAGVAQAREGHKIGRLLVTDHDDRIVTHRDPPLALAHGEHGTGLIAASRPPTWRGIPLASSASMTSIATGLVVAVRAPGLLHA